MVVCKSSEPRGGGAGESGHARPEAAFREGTPLALALRSPGSMRRTSALVASFALLLGASPALAEEPGSTIKVVPAKRRAPEPTPTEASPAPRKTSADGSPVRAPDRASALPAAPPLPAVPRSEEHHATGLTPDPRLSTQARGPGPLPWVTLTGSLLVGAAGAVFAVRTMNAIDEGMQIEVTGAMSGGTVRLPAEFQDQQRAIIGNGLAATVLISTAAAGAVTSLILLLSQ